MSIPPFLKAILDQEKPAIRLNDSGFEARGIDYVISYRASQGKPSSIVHTSVIAYSDSAVNMVLMVHPKVFLSYGVKDGHAAPQLEVLGRSETDVARTLRGQLQRGDMLASAEVREIGDAIRLIEEQIKYQKFICIQ